MALSLPLTTSMLKLPMYGKAETLRSPQVMAFNYGLFTHAKLRVCLKLNPLLLLSILHALKALATDIER